MLLPVLPDKRLAKRIKMTLLREFNYIINLHNLQKRIGKHLSILNFQFAKHRKHDIIGIQNKNKR